MNKFGSISIAALFALSGWLHYQTHLQLIELETQKVAADEELRLVNEQLANITKQFDELQSAHSPNPHSQNNSLDSMVKEANDALISGWESLVNTVSEELKKAGEQSPQPESPNPPAPSLESPDGTERI
ncbi:MAG: hypothetical protein ACRBBW_12840 [Cellvibrionaceae bacterium]